jgi:hypothetical protein
MSKLAVLVTIAIWAAVLAFVVWFIGVCNAQAPDRHGDYGVGHSENHSWYQGLHNNAGMSCCNAGDCRPTEARTAGEKVQVLIDGEWVDVPPDRILPKGAPDMGTHVCAPPHVKGTNWIIYCVIIGNGV